MRVTRRGKPQLLSGRRVEYRILRSRCSSMSAFTMYTTSWCGYCHRLKSQLNREGITFDEVNIEKQPDAAQVVEKANHGNQTVPTNPNVQ